MFMNMQKIWPDIFTQEFQIIESNAYYVLNTILYFYTNLCNPQIKSRLRLCPKIKCGCFHVIFTDKTT